jgi:hypothetical protein
LKKTLTILIANTIGHCVVMSGHRGLAVLTLYGGSQSIRASVAFSRRVAFWKSAQAMVA